MQFRKFSKYDKLNFKFSKLEFNKFGLKFVTNELLT